MVSKMMMIVGKRREEVMIDVYGEIVELLVEYIL